MAVTITDIARMAKVSNEKLAGGANGREDFYKTKLTTGRFFMERVLPEADAHFARISSGSETMMALDADAF